MYDPRYPQLPQTQGDVSNIFSGLFGAAPVNPQATVDAGAVPMPPRQLSGAVARPAAVAAAPEVPLPPRRPANLVPGDMTPEHYGFGPYLSTENFAPAPGNSPYQPGLLEEAAAFPPPPVRNPYNLDPRATSLVPRLESSGEVGAWPQFALNSHGLEDWNGKAPYDFRKPYNPLSSIETPEGNTHAIIQRLLRGVNGPAPMGSLQPIMPMFP